MYLLQGCACEHDRGMQPQANFLNVCAYLSCELKYCVLHCMAAWTYRSSACAISGSTQRG